MQRKTVEYDIQCAIVKHARRIWPALATLMWATPNGGNRDAHTGAMMKREGVTAGVWDLCIAIPRYSYATMWIEVKDPARRNYKNGGLTDSQLAWGEDMRNQGHNMVVAYSCREAIDHIERYLGSV